MKMVRHYGEAIVTQATRSYGRHRRQAWQGRHRKWQKGRRRGGLVAVVREGKGNSNI